MVVLKLSTSLIDNRAFAAYSVRLNFLHNLCLPFVKLLKSTASFYQPSVTTDEIDKAVHKMIIDAGAYPSPLGYGGFPKSVCTSVNECMCHGIPDSRELQVQF